jgi:hypothetical protein
MSQVQESYPDVQTRRHPRVTPCLRALAAFALAGAAMVSARPASADTLIINRPGYHPRYRFEAEPHLLLGFVDPPGYANGNGFGIGFRGTLKVVDNGFIPNINNNVGIGFGLDFVHYGSSRCLQFNLSGRCTSNDAVNDVWVPIVMQWNFFLSRNWSVFGEPGVAMRFESYDGPGNHTHFEWFQLYLGGRFHFTDNITLTMRVGYPTFSIGASFLL